MSILFVCLCECLSQLLDKEKRHSGELLSLDLNAELKAQLDSTRTRLQEAGWRCEDTARAYEQERREKEQREGRIGDLEELLKVRTCSYVPAENEITNSWPFSFLQNGHQNDILTQWPVEFIQA